MKKEINKIIVSLVHALSYSDILKLHITKDCWSPLFIATALFWYADEPKNLIYSILDVFRLNLIIMLESVGAEAERQERSLK